MKIILLFLKTNSPYLMRTLLGRDKKEASLLVQDDSALQQSTTTEERNTQTVSFQDSKNYQAQIYFTWKSISAWIKNWNLDVAGIFERPH